MNARPYLPVLHGAAADRPDEADTVDTARTIRDALERLGYRSGLVHLGLDLAAVRSLALQRPTLVFNLVDAIDGDAALAHFAPAALDHAGLRYTGASTEAWCLTLSKVSTKRLLIAAGLPTPAFSLDAGGLAADGSVIVKSLTEHASLGIDAQSVVPASRAAAEILERQCRFGSRFFAEAYIEGREFNLSVVETDSGPRVLPPAEIDFADFPAGRPRIVDYEAKWIPDSNAYSATPRRFDFPESDAVLIARLEALAIDCWTLFGLGGYARVDFRVDADGNPWILEVNMNPCLAPDAGFAAAAAQAGIDYDAMIALIVEAAIERDRKVA